MAEPGLTVPDLSIFGHQRDLTKALHGRMSSGVMRREGIGFHQ